jgi:hypothetical protein
LISNNNTLGQQQVRRDPARFPVSPTRPERLSQLDSPQRDADEQAIEEQQPLAIQPIQIVYTFGQLLSAQTSTATVDIRNVFSRGYEPAERKPGPHLADAAAVTPTVVSPRAALVAKLRALRARAIAKGMRLLSEDEIVAEIERMRRED